AFTRLVLPPPDGAATTNRLPAPCASWSARPSGAGGSLKVLHLLAHLLDQHLELEGRLRQLGIDRLGAERVRLAMQLLHEEIESLAGRAAGAHHAAHFAYVRRQARELLRDVRLRREDRELLLQALLVGIDAGLAQARAELVDEGRVDRRNARRDALH